MADTGLPASARQPVAEHAVRMLREQILASPEPVTLVTLAPLTNIALLLRTHPEVAGQHRARDHDGRLGVGGQRDRRGGVQRVARPGGRGRSCSARGCR